MPWDPRSSINVAIFFCLISIFLASPVQAMNCSATNISVDKPVVKFMFILSKLFISWESKPGLTNCTLYYCCRPPTPGFVSRCHSICPNSLRVDDCFTEKKNNKHILYCRLLVNQQISYTIYWNTTFHGCNITSEPANITPVVENGQWPAVDKLTMEIQSKGLQMGWLHSYQDVYEDLCFFYTFHEIEGTVRTIKVREAETEKFHVNIPFPHGGGHPMKIYEFCIKVRLCFWDDAPFSDEICNQSQIPPEAPSKPPKWLCGDVNKPCPAEVKNNLRNITLLWEVPDNWNGIPIGINLEVRNMENDITKHVLNSSATNYTLRGLRTDSEYRVVLSMCSNGGCSGISTPVVLRATQEIEHSKGVFVSPTLWAVLVPCAVLVLLLIVTCFVLERRKTGNETIPLPPLHEPIPGVACSDHSVTTSLYCNTNDYDHLHHDRCARLIDRSWNSSDTSSLGINENGYDSCSIDSFESASGRPLLSKAPQIADSAGSPRVMVTYLAHPSGTL